MKGLCCVLVAAGLILGVSSASSGSVIYDNINPNGGVLFNSSENQPSQLDNGFGFDAGVADDFRLTGSPGGWSATDVSWYGRFVTGLPVDIGGFNIIFWPDAGGQPAGGQGPGDPPKYNQALAIISNVPATSVASAGGDRNFYYTATFPTPLALQDNVTYWIEIQAVTNYPPLWDPEMTLNSTGGHPHYGWTFFSTPFWTGLGAAEDMAFQLGGSAVPEPASAVVLLGAFCGMLLRRRA